MSCWYAREALLNEYFQWAGLHGATATIYDHGIRTTLTLMTIEAKHALHIDSKDTAINFDREYFNRVKLSLWKTAYGAAPWRNFVAFAKGRANTDSYGLGFYMGNLNSRFKRWVWDHYPDTREEELMAAACLIGSLSVWASPSNMKDLRRYWADSQWELMEMVEELRLEATMDVIHTFAHNS